jgi:DNA-binding NtrC family response regulator
MKAEQHILIVDNDDKFRKAANIILSREGYLTSIAGNGQEAMNIIRTTQTNSHPVDILLTDIRMPEMDGFDLITSTKREHFHIPTIVITAYSDAETFARLIHCGVSGYLAKPCKVKDLLDAIRSASQKATSPTDDVPACNFQPAVDRRNTPGD